MRLMDSVLLGVATVSAGAVFAAPVADGAAREPARIAFLCGRNTHDLCLARPDGTGRRQLTRGDAVADGTFGKISRGASLLAFIHRDETIRVRTLGGRPVAKVRTRWRNPGTVELDRTATHLLYTDTDLFGNTHVCRLRIGARKPSCFPSSRAYHAWGPGGTVISTEPAQRSDICVETRGNACARRIVGIGPSGSLYGPAALSPDGRRLAVIEDQVLDPAADARVVTFSARTGRRLHVLTTGHRDGNPSWSRDGRWIVFDRDAVIRAPRPNSQVIFASLWRVPAGGGDPRPVTRRGYQPAWAS